jgi:Family of unknown function (DUF5994)
MTASVALPIDGVDDADIVGLPEPAARILLKPPGGHPGVVNGAWWPRSRDLARELPLLVAALGGIWGRTYHATEQADMWPEIPKRVRTGEHIVRVGRFDAEQDPHEICLLSVPGRGRWDLLVVPSEFDLETAAQLMATAASPGNMQPAGSLIATASVPLASSAGAYGIPSASPPGLQRAGRDSHGTSSQHFAN